MKFLFSEKCLILIFCLLFVSSSLFLFWKNERELDPNQGKSWWTLSFATPENPQNLDFTLENHGTETQFRYQVSQNKNVLKEAMVTIERGATQTVTLDITGSTDARTIITVTTETEKKEIYR
ncbi:MAG: VCBS domain-containing protein [Candidatus Moraniibacteriota bacterium]